MGMPDLMDEIIRDAMRNGQLANLPGQGKPLQVEDDSNVPQHLRLAHKILKDNDFAPEWIMQGKDLDAAREQWRSSVRREIRAFRSALADANRAPTPEAARTRVEARWEQTAADLRTEGQAINQQILTYNLKVPPGVTHKILLDLDELTLR